MIDSNREEFEKLPEIAERLHTVFYNEDLNQYHAAMINSGLSVRYIQGAWYSWQAHVSDGYKLVPVEDFKHIGALNKDIESAYKEYLKGITSTTDRLIKTMIGASE